MTRRGHRRQVHRQRSQRRQFAEAAPAPMGGAEWTSMAAPGSDEAVTPVSDAPGEWLRLSAA